MEVEKMTEEEAFVAVKQAIEAENNVEREEKPKAEASAVSQKEQRLISLKKLYNEWADAEEKFWNAAKNRLK